MVVRLVEAEAVEGVIGSVRGGGGGGDRGCSLLEGRLFLIVASALFMSS